MRVKVTNSGFERELDTTAKFVHEGIGMDMEEYDRAMVDVISTVETTDTISEAMADILRRWEGFDAFVRIYMLGKLIGIGDGMGMILEELHPHDW